jgi:hypothetical protein
VIVSKMEDTLTEGFKGHRQLSYAHWICFLIFMALAPLPAEVMAELTCTTTEFLEYDMHQMMGSSTGSRTPRQQRHQSLEVSETVAEQDEAIKALTDTELEQLEAQQEDMLESDLTDNSNEDYQPIPRMPPRAHNREVSGSSSAPPQLPQRDPALIAILDRMQQEQTRQA